jgi:hypothetical protein
VYCNYFHPFLGLKAMCQIDPLFDFLFLSCFELKQTVSMEHSSSGEVIVPQLVKKIKVNYSVHKAQPLVLPSER